MACEHYALERFQAEDDHPDWGPYGEFFRTRQAAEARAEKYNTQTLERHVEALRADHARRVRAYREDQALVAAGLRQSATWRDPGEFTPPVQIGQWGERYRAVPIEFEDDREVT